VVDIWAAARRRLRITPWDYGLVGRWLAYVSDHSRVMAHIGGTCRVSSNFKENSRSYPPHRSGTH